MYKRKRTLLKQVSFMLAILLVFVSVSGCNGGDKVKEQTAPESKTSEEKDDVTPSSTKEELTDSGIPPVAAGITQFMEVKGKAYEMLEPMTDNISEKNALAPMSLMSLLVTDLTLIPLTMIAAVPKTGDNVWQGPIMMMDGKGHVELKGDICTFNMEVKSQDGSNEIMMITGEYDTKRDSLQAIFSVDGKETIMFEYVASGKGYVSQLFSMEDETTTLIKQAFDENTLYAGVVSEGGKPESVYKQNVEFGENFVKNDALMVVLENGKGYAIIDNEKYEY